MCLWIPAIAAWLATAAAQEPGRPVEPVIPEGSGVELRLTDELGGVSNRSVDTLEPSTAVSPVARGGSQRGLRLELSGTTRFDNNVRRTPFAQEHALIMELEPRVYLEAGFSRSRFVLGYEGAYAAHVDLSREDYDDHNFFAETDLGLHRKVRLLGHAGYEFGHDPRGGVTSRVLTFGPPDRWQEHRLGLEMVLGRRIAKAEIRGTVNFRGRRYVNNRQFIRDFEERVLWLNTRWNITPRLAAVVEGGKAFIDYLDARSRLDGDRAEFLYGVAWEATEKTSGSFKIGQLWRNYRDDLEEDRKGSNWDVRINWSPRPYSRLTFFTKRSIEESAGLLSGGSVGVQTFGARWRHGFTTRTEFEIGVERAKADYFSGRDDTLTRWDVELRHAVHRWLDVAAGFEIQRRNSKDPLADYDAQIVYVRLDVRGNRRLGR